MPSKREMLLREKQSLSQVLFSKHSRDEYKELIENNGGKNSSSVSGNTSFILAGENMGQSKKEKADELGVPLLMRQNSLK